MTARALEAIEQVLDRGGDADDILRAVLDVLVAEPEIDWAGIRFVEGGELVLGPMSGIPDETRRRLTTIAYRGDPVGELAIDGSPEPELLDRVATLISPHVLLGWDTGGSAWEP